MERRESAPAIARAPKRPLYRIPTLDEIRATPPNGLTAISTFSGCGGTSTGLRWSGYRVAWASEFIPAARATYLANYPDATVDERDIRSVSGASILDATGLRVGELDLLEGSPPCAAFSTSGRRAVSWERPRKYSETTQRTDDLIFEFARLVRELSPRAFSMENVSGLTKGVGVGMLKRLVAELRESGYAVDARLVDAQWLGVPQARVRLFVLGVRSDLGRAPVFPPPLPYRYSIREALGELVGRVVADDDGARRTVTLGTWDATAIGREWASLTPGRESERYFNLKRASWDRPLRTLTTFSRGAAVMHPDECRRFTLAELRRLCGFPDDFELVGTYDQQLERLGRAVPPPVARAIGATLAPILLGENADAAS